MKFMAIAYIVFLFIAALFGLIILLASGHHIETSLSGGIPPIYVIILLFVTPIILLIYILHGKYSLILQSAALTCLILLFICFIFDGLNNIRGEYQGFQYLLLIMDIGMLLMTVLFIIILSNKKKLYRFFFE